MPEDYMVTIPIERAFLRLDDVLIMTDGELERIIGMMPGKIKVKRWNHQKGRLTVFWRNLDQIWKKVVSVIQITPLGESATADHHSPTT